MRSVSENKNVNLQKCLNLGMLPSVLFFQSALAPMAWYVFPAQRQWIPWVLGISFAITGVILRKLIARREDDMDGLRDVIEGYRMMARETSALVAQCLARDEGVIAALSNDEVMSPVFAEATFASQEVEASIRSVQRGRKVLSGAFCEFVPPELQSQDAGSNIAQAMEEMISSLAFPGCRMMRVGEYGYALLLPDITALRLAVALERLRERWQSMVFGLDLDTPFTVKALFAVTRWEVGMSAEQFLRAGEKALEEARRSGGAVTVAKE
jgi:hypothetical protein